MYLLLLYCQGFYSFEALGQSLNRLFFCSSRRKEFCIYRKIPTLEIDMKRKRGSHYFSSQLTYKVGRVVGSYKW